MQVEKGWATRHYTPPGGVRGKQLDPGTVLKATSAVGFWATVAVMAARMATALGEVAGEVVVP
ncbi:MAG: hypothetical protein WBQ04_07595 [Candidatus Acidiferrales bacterium]